MSGIQSFDEIRVYAGVAERTGMHFERNDVRHSGGCCRSLTELLRKGRASGDGYFYLPPGIWPVDTGQIELQKKWVVVSSLPRNDLPEGTTIRLKPATLARDSRG
jgi:hypothetical protein